MLQQLMFQGQQQSRGPPGPPPMGGTPDVFRQTPQGSSGPAPPRGFEQDGNIHIEKLLNQQNYDY